MENSLTQQKRALTIKDQLQGQAFKDAVAKALPTHLKPDRFIRVALTAMTRTPKLAQCDQASFFQCLLSLSQLGLEPDGRRAHLIPFENRKRGVTECQLIVDYKGLSELAMRSGVVSNIHADIVCENDEFEYDRGELKKHRIDFKKPRGPAYAVYSLCRFKDGGEKCDVMTVEDVEAIRKRSRAGSNGPWVTDWNEMAKKTVFRRLSKWLPLSPEYRDALDADADELEAQRVDNAKPITVMAVESPFEQLTDAQPEAQQQDPAPATETGPQPSTQTILAEIVTVSAGANFDAWKAYAVSMGHLTDAQAENVNSFEDVPEELAGRHVNARAGIIRALKGGTK